MDKWKNKFCEFVFFYFEFWQFNENQNNVENYLKKKMIVNIVLQTWAEINSFKKFQYY